MPSPMTIYRLPTVKHPEHEFREIRGGRMAYFNYGNLKTYANKTQCENKVAALRFLGFDCYRTFDHPFLILLNK